MFEVLQWGRRGVIATSPHGAAAAAAPQVPTFQPTQGDAALGLDVALGELAFQDAAEEAAPEQPTELPEWACACVRPPPALCCLFAEPLLCLAWPATTLSAAAGTRWGLCRERVCKSQQSGMQQPQCAASQIFPAANLCPLLPASLRPPTPHLPAATAASTTPPAWSSA